MIFCFEGTLSVGFVGLEGSHWFGKLTCSGSLNLDLSC